MIFAGIGSRDTPAVIQFQMGEIAHYLTLRGWLLRSGGARGADTAFERRSHKTELFLPWSNYNDHSQLMDELPAWTIPMVEKYHGDCTKLDEQGWLLHRRNMQIILGRNGDHPVNFVVCWTPLGEITGGTATGIIVAKAHNLPVFNLAYDKPEQVYEYASNCFGDFYS